MKISKQIIEQNDLRMGFQSLFPALSLEFSGKRFASINRQNH